MSSSHGALIIFGSGPGVGRNVATLFAERGFGKVFLLSRNANRLSQDGDAVRSVRADADVYEFPLDLGNAEHVKKALRKISENLNGTPLEFVLFNGSRTGKSEILEFAPESLANDLSIAVVSLYTVAQWAIPRLLDSATSTITPSLLVTSGMLAKDPYPAMFSLAASKAAQYSLAHSLHKEFESQGVHCGLVVIGGTVSDDSEVTNARNIAEETWKMFSQPRGEGKLEVLLTDPGFDEHVKNRESRC